MRHQQSTIGIMECLCTLCLFILVFSNQIAAGPTAPGKANSDNHEEHEGHEEQRRNQVNDSMRIVPVPFVIPVLPLPFFVPFVSFVVEAF